MAWECTFITKTKSNQHQIRHYRGTLLPTTSMIARMPYQRRVTTLFAVSLMIASLVLCQPSQAESSILQQKQPQQPQHITVETADAATSRATSTQLNLEAKTENAEVETDILIDWQGPWHFEKEWFGKQHPWLPRFIKNKALQSTLIVDDEFYHQVDDEGKALKEKRRLVIKSVDADRAVLTRMEGKKEIEFSIEKRSDGFLYYCEGKSSIYQIHRPPQWQRPNSSEQKTTVDCSTTSNHEQVDHDEMVIETMERWEPEF